MKNLATIKTGEKGIIKKMDCEQKLNTRLCDLGLYQKNEIEIVKNDFSNPVIIKVLNTKLAIGRKEAANIFLE